MRQPATPRKTGSQWPQKATTRYEDVVKLQRGPGDVCTVTEASTTMLRIAMPSNDTVVARTCAECGRLFDALVANVRRGYGRFCSVSCGGKSRVTDPATRFWSKVQQTDTCWIWTGTRRNGYGVFSIRDQRVKAHRFAYADTYGPIGEGLVICHRCDNPPCVRPDHLFPGTVSENAVDMAKKGRQVFQQHPERVRRGEASNKARLTPDDVRAIRAMYAAGGVRLIELAERFGVHLTTIHGVVTGRTWRHLV